jgi:hypothetical protein
MKAPGSQMPDKAIVTLTIGESARKEARYSHPYFRLYAQKTGADFIVIDKPQINREKVYYEKYQLFFLLEKYNRVLFVDTDCLIAPECPDLFKVVPQGKLGVHILSLTPSLAEDIKKIQASCGQIGWEDVYFSSGVFLASKIHSGLFAQENSCRYISEWYPDQTEINYNAQRLNLGLFDIGEKFEYIGPRSDKLRWRKDFSRFSAYIVHYAGNWLYRGHRIHEIKWDSRILALPRVLRKFCAAVVLLARIAAYRMRLFRISLMRLRHK